MELTCSMATRLVESCLWDFGNRTRPYSGCTGGAWVASKEWNLDNINRCFQNQYDSLERAWFIECSEIIDVLDYEKKSLKRKWDQIIGNF